MTATHNFVNLPAFLIKNAAVMEMNYWTKRSVKLLLLLLSPPFFREKNWMLRFQAVAAF